MLDYSTGKISFILIVAALLACVGSAWLAHRYRAEMRRLMSAPLGAQADVAAQPASEPSLAEPGPLAQPVSYADNRRAGWRVVGLLAALSLLISLSTAALFLTVSMGEGALTPGRLGLFALVHLWPMIPALGLLWRWSRWRIVGALVLWCVFCFGVMLWRSIEPRPLLLVQFLAIDIGPPLALVALLCLGNTTRAIALWLLVPTIVLVWASIVGVDLLWWIFANRRAWLEALPAWIGAEAVMIAFVLLPWLVAWWPLRRIGRALGRAYAHKRLCELLVLFTAVWAITLVYQALGAASDLGAGGVVMLLPLAWIPIGAAVFRRIVPRPQAAPTLLVLRVFQHDAQVQHLYDHVVERWRLSGNTVLIAGTDLIGRTTDADDIFTFLDGGLSKRFIREPADVGPRLAAFDVEPDADARFRVNECYCHDTTWQDALRALVERADVALMDLRGFRARNAGCRFELATLARSARIGRVVVLTDAQTDRAIAEADVQGAPAGRITWIDASRIDARKQRETLAALFDPPTN